MRVFEEQVGRTPEEVAVSHPSGRLTYRQLNTMANLRARQLVQAGVGRQSPVPLVMGRSADVVVTALAVMKAGGFYIPVHLSSPAARLREIVTDVGANIVVTDSAAESRGRDSGVRVFVADGLPAGTPEVPNPSPYGLPGELAYVMYTSGSTGAPKGVAVTHRDILDLVADSAWRTGHERVLVHSAHAFDASTYEMWVPLLTGGRVVVAPPGQLDTAGLRSLVEQHAVTAMFLTTALFSLFAEQDPACFSGMHTVATGGELMPVQAMRGVRTACPDVRVLHVYGPTETTTFATRHRVDEVGDPVPIGQPLDGVRC
ncbi:non-ribosomal peptide synthetase, partial [Amycolatopsis vastitatis]